MRKNIFIATFSYGAVDVIKENQLNIEINHTCISEELNPENREKLLAAIRRDVTDCGADRVILHGPFTEIRLPSTPEPEILQSSGWRRPTRSARLSVPKAW